MESYLKSLSVSGGVCLAPVTTLGLRGLPRDHLPTFKGRMWGGQDLELSLQVTTWVQMLTTPWAYPLLPRLVTQSFLFSSLLSWC